MSTTHPSPEKGLTQCEEVLRHLQTRGSITALEAIDLYGCMRLAARISDLKKQGHGISAKSITTKGGATIARYSLTNITQPSLF